MRGCGAAGGEIAGQARNDGKGLFFGFLAAEGGEAEEFVVGGWFDGGGVGLAEFEVEFFVGVAEAAPDGDVVFVVLDCFPEFLTEPGVGFEAVVVADQVHGEAPMGAFVVDGVVPEGEFDVGGEGCRRFRIKSGMTGRRC